MVGRAKLLIPAAAISTSLMWASRSILFPLVGLGPYNYGHMPERYFMEFPAQTMGYIIAVSLTILYDRQVRAVAVEIRRRQREIAGYAVIDCEIDHLNRRPLQVVITENLQD